MARRIKKPGPTCPYKVPEALGDFKPVKPVLQFTSLDRFLTILGFRWSFPGFSQESRAANQISMGRESEELEEKDCSVPPYRGFSSHHVPATTHLVPSLLLRNRSGDDHRRPGMPSD